MPSVPPAASAPVDSDARIAVPAQFRQRDLSHRGGGGERRTADGAETGARTDRRDRDTTLAMAEKGADEAKQRLRQPAVRGELAHEQEQWNHHQVVVGQPRVGEALERIEQGDDVAPGEVDIARGSHTEHRDTDRNAHDHQRQHHAEDDEADLGAAHWRAVAAGGARNAARRCNAAR